jgi:hypothetical protein
MGKKVSNETIKRSSVNKTRKKSKTSLNEVANHPSPASRSSDTAVNFEDNEDTPVGLAKSFQMRKA